MYIVVEGIDGSGKSTLISKLIKNYSDFELVCEPGTTEVAKKLRQIMLHQDSELNINTQLLLMYAARSDLFNKIIIPNLERNKSILADRCNLSSFAYQLYPLQQQVISQKGQLAFDMLDLWIQLNNFSQNNISPDLYIYLRLPDVNVGLERINLIKEQDNIEKKGIDYLQCVSQGFDKIFDFILTASRKINPSFKKDIEGFDLYEIEKDQNYFSYVAVIDANLNPEVVFTLANLTVSYVRELITQRQAEIQAILAHEACKLEMESEICCSD